MEPITASLVVGLLMRYAKHLAGTAGDLIDDAAKKGLDGIWAAVRKRFSHEPDATAALDRAADEPDNPRRQAALEDFLDEIMARDKEFTASLTQLMQNLPPSSIQVKASDSGAIAAGGDVSISGGQFAAGRDVITNRQGPGTS